MSVVYFACREDGFGPIKIGFSTNPASRVKALGNALNPIAVLTTIPGCYYLERRFHQRFLPAWEYGEWFQKTDDLLSVVEEIKAGNFDTSTLPEARTLPHSKSVRGFRKITKRPPPIPKDWKVTQKASRLYVEWTMAFPANMTMRQARAIVRQIQNHSLGKGKPKEFEWYSRNGLNHIKRVS